MRFSLSNISLGALALGALSAQAQLTVVEPSGDHWWVAQSTNTLRWTGNTPAEFSVYIYNPDTTVLVDKLALIAIQPAYEYSKSINPGIMRPGGGYTIQLVNPLNSTQVYASSPTFEIRAVNSPYPPQTTAAPSGSGGSGSGSASSGGANAQSSVTATSSRSSGGEARYGSMQYAPMLLGGVLVALVW